MRRALLATFLVLIVPFLRAQNQCAFILEEAQDMFDAGLIETIPEKLADCLLAGFTDEEKLQAHKLVILSYIYDDNVEEADAAMLNFLEDFPDYEPLATDPRDFVVLMETYDTRPVLMIGGSLGTNLTFPLVISTLGTYDFIAYNGDYLPGGAGFHGSFKVEKHFYQHIDLSIELQFNNNRFDFYLDSDVEEQFTGEITDFSMIDYYETQNRIALPISMTYSFSETDFKPFVCIGAAPGFLLTATGEGLRNYKNTGDIRYDPVSVAGVNLLPVRRRFNAWAFIGGGIKYSIGPGEFFLDARFYVNVQNQVKPGSPRFIQKLAFESFYVSDDLLLNNLAFSVGYLFPIYNPKKKED